MGTICIFLGIIFLIASTACGVLLCNSILANSLYLSLLGMSNTPSLTLYLIVVGICFVIGLLVCLNLVMHGLTYNKVCKIDAKMKKDR